MTPVERLQAAIEKLEQLRAGAEPVVGYDVKARAELIVTLHRTLDAQLAILRRTHARIGSKLQRGALPSAVWSTEHDGLALADAILGEA